MAGYAALLAMAMLVVILPVAMAQSTGPTCLSISGASCAVEDANVAINALRTNPNLCCQLSGRNTLMYEYGSCALTISGDRGWCLPCAMVGNYFNIALAQCNRGGEVQAGYAVNGSLRILYLTSGAVRPRDATVDSA